MQGLPQYSVVLLEQIRTVDKARLGNFVGVMDKETLNKIDESVMCSLGLTDGFRT
jgi:mRNA interferase MazF